MAKRATDATSKQLIAGYRSTRKQLAQQTERLRTGSSGDSTDKLKRGLARLEDQTAHARAELIEHWNTTDQDEVALERLLRELDYRAEVAGMFSVSYASSAMTGARARQEKLERELRDYWLAAGHNLHDLDRVLADTESDAIDLLPK